MSQFEVDPDQEFHVLLNGQTVALSLDALAEAYEGDVITESTLIFQPQFPQWLPLASVLAELDSPGTAASMAPLMPDTFQVLIEGQESKQMNYHSLRDAVRLGVIPLSARVWRPGFPAWAEAAQILGADAVAPQAVEAPAPVGYGTSRPPARTGGPSVAPSAASNSGRPAPRSDGPTGSLAAPAPPSGRPAPRVDGPSRAPTMPGPFTAPPSMAPSSMAPQQDYAAAAAYSNAPVSGRPAPRTDGPSRAPEAAPFSSRAPAGFEAPIPSGYASAPQASLAPVALGSLSASQDDEMFKPAKRNPWPVRGLGLLAAAVAIFALYRNGIGSEALGSSAAAQASGDVTTPQGMNSWLNSVDSKHGLTSSTSPAQVKGSPALAAPASESTSSGKLKLAELPKEDASSAAPKPSTAFGDLLNKKESKAAPAPKAKAGKAVSSAPRPAKKAAKAGGHASDAYDPMNGTL